LDNKKSNEIEILKLFRDLCPDFPKGILKTSESPDFILSVGPRRKIGMELTRLNQRVPGLGLFSYENIRACLSSKDEKLGLYKRKRLQEYWLILFVGDSEYNSPFNLHNKLNKWVFESGFNRIFLLSVAGNRIYELQTAQES